MVRRGKYLLAVKFFKSKEKKDKYKKIIKIVKKFKSPKL